MSEILFGKVERLFYPRTCSNFRTMHIVQGWERRLIPNDTGRWLDKCNAGVGDLAEMRLQHAKDEYMTRKTGKQVRPKTVVKMTLKKCKSDPIPEGLSGGVKERLTRSQPAQWPPSHRAPCPPPPPPPPRLDRLDYATHSRLFELHQPSHPVPSRGQARIPCPSLRLTVPPRRHA
jgi:hypothetical protein